MATKPTGRPRGRPRGASANARRDAFLHELVADLMDVRQGGPARNKVEAAHLAHYLLTPSAKTANKPGGRWSTPVLIDEQSRRFQAHSDVVGHGDLTPLQKTSAHYTDSKGRAHYWPDMVRVHFPKIVNADHSDRSHWEERGADFVQLVVDWWNQWLRRKMYSDPSLIENPLPPIRLAPSRIQEIYEDAQSKVGLERHVCQWCGHENVSNPARGEQIEDDDPCRKCGATIRVPFTR